MIVLASASPRRRALLKQAGLEFSVHPTDVDEGLEPGVEPGVAAQHLAERKARALFERGEHPAAWIIGSDTVVAIADEAAGWQLLGKPESSAQARSMLRRLSATRHRVITGVAVLRASDGVLESAIETTWVSMRVITPDEIEAYVASGEWRDKAGGYAIQGQAAVFVERLVGSYSGVMGLPLFETAELLRAAGVAVIGVAR